MTFPPLAANPDLFAGIDEEIDKIIGDEDGQTLDELETLRKKYIHRYYLGVLGVLLIPVLGILVAWLFMKLHINKPIIFELIVFLWQIAFLVGLVPILMYKSKAKQILMPSLVSLFGDLSWSPTAPMTGRFWDDLRASDLIASYSGAAVTDLIAGSIKGTKITLVNGSLGYGKTSLPVCGIHIRLQKPVPLRLILKPHFSGGSTKNLTQVNIPSPEFAHAFLAYSDDQVLARTLLTPDVVEQLIRLATLFGGQRLGVSLWSDNLFFLAENAEDMAPESLFTSAYKLDRVHKVGRQLYLLSLFIDTIVKDWRLNPTVLELTPAIPETIASL